MIAVVKRVRGKALPTGSVYVGRGTQWGNPYVIGVHGTREQVIERYRDWIGQHYLRVDALARWVEERGATALACWCAPEPCHADVLAELLANRKVVDDGLASNE